jgi:hypothetical protein
VEIDRQEVSLTDYTEFLSIFMGVWENGACDLTLMRTRVPLYCLMPLLWGCCISGNFVIDPTMLEFWVVPCCGLDMVRVSQGFRSRNIIPIVKF